MRGLLTLFIIFGWIASPKASAQLGPLLEDVRSNPFVLLADRISGSLKTGLVELAGNVRVATNDASLSMQSVKVTPATITLLGPIKAISPEASLSADKIILDRQKQSGRIEKLFLETAQGYASARLASVEADGSVTLSDTLISKCAGCYRNHPAPWQVYIREARYTPGDEQIRVRDAQLVLFGVPVVRIPYWQILNPAIDRFSGYLPISIEGTDAGGTGLQVSRFWDINIHEDVTLSLTAYEQSAVVGSARYRWADANAWFEASARAAWMANGSSSHSYFGGQRESAGDLSLRGDWFIDDKSRLKGAGTWATHDDFLDGFGPTADNYGRAHVTWEQFDGPAYTNVSLSHDQLQTSSSSAPFSQAELPYRLSLSHDAKQSLSSVLDIFWGADFLSAHRDTGRDSARLVGYTGFAPSPVMLGAGRLVAEGFAIGGLAQASGLDLTSNDVNPQNPNYSGTSDFALLGGSVEWSADLLHPTAPGMTISPRARVTHLSGTEPDERFANEDATLTYLSHAGQWQAAHEGPFDRTSTGTWMDIGLGIQSSHGNLLTSGFAGARLNHRDGDIALLSSSLTHISLPLNATYEGRWDVDKTQILSHDLRIEAPLGSWRTGISYAYESSASDLASGEEIGFDLSGEINEHWSMSLSISDDLGVADSLTIETKTRFADCCMGLNFYASYDENLGTPETKIGFELDLIGLGVLGSSSLLTR